MNHESPHYSHVLSNIMRAVRHTKSGNMKEARYHIKMAHKHAGKHVQHLVSQGRHVEAREFQGSFANYAKDLEGLFSAAKKQKKEPFFKSEETQEKVKYKPFTDLEPKHQNRVSHWFGSKDMHMHAYPVDKETGNVIHAPRIPVEKAEDSKPAERKQESANRSERANSLVQDATKALRTLRGAGKK